MWMDRDILFEALSALTECKVKPHTECTQNLVADLTVENLLYEVLLKSVLSSATLGSVSPWVSALLIDDDDQISGDSEISDLRKELFVDLDTFLDPSYDYDFRNCTDSSECSRGGESYKRPVGWYRFGLRVKDKYPDGNAWLGSIGWRSHSEAGEWPVSFHGTSIEAAKGIASSHYRAGDGRAYGRGVYSTPDITLAEGYTMTKTFTSEKTGKTYRVIMQNRINPEKRVITVKPDYWLVPVPVGSTAQQEKEIVESSIRPYGILIREVEITQN